MKNAVLLIGSGGREHAIALALRRSASVGDLFCAPGNAGMADVGTVTALDVSDHAAVLRFVEQKNIALTVIGPEAPLVAGLPDALRAKNHLVLGASKDAAMLEGSKIQAKTFMAKYGIPTAGFKVFSNPTEAKAFARSPEGAAFRVMKADGLAAGKGVVVAETAEGLVEAIDDAMVTKRFGAAGDKIILEETLTGPEVSLMALTDGRTVLPFPASQDHKRVFDNDEGPNTGGMGAYAPTSFYDDLTRVEVEKNIIQNFVRGVQAEGWDFRGIIYFGLMLTKKGPKVLEFNVRLGDPEAEVIMPLIESDVFELFKAVAEGNLSNVSLQLKPGFACTVVMASGGYPGSFETGLPITGLDAAAKTDRVFVFHAGTKEKDGAFSTSGGRVLSVTGLGKTLDAAVVRAYQGVKRISFSKAHFRNDIAGKALKNRRITQRIRRMKDRRVATLGKA